MQKIESVGGGGVIAGISTTAIIIIIPVILVTNSVIHPRNGAIYLTYLLTPYL